MAVENIEIDDHTFFPQISCYIGKFDILGN